MRRLRRYRIADLFSGAGGLTEGFRETGLCQPTFAVELDAAAAETYAKNFGHSLIHLQESGQPFTVRRKGTILQGDIGTIGEVRLKIDVVIGGPPCQGFSPLGAISPRSEHGQMNQLWQQYMRIVCNTRPLAFVIENVPAILRSTQYRGLRSLAKRMGYEVEAATLKAIEYGVPQRRVRCFIVGLLGGIKPEFPCDSGDRKTVRQSIGDLPPEPTTMEVGRIETLFGGGKRQDLHIGRNPTVLSLRRYQLIKPGENRFALVKKAPEITPRCWKNKPTGSTDVFGRLQWDDYAYTIRTEFFKPEKGCYLHPEQDRPITHREAARLQTFDDSFVFCGNKQQVARQIGNAVPPKLARAVAQQLFSQLPQVEKSIRSGWRPPDVDFDACMRDALLEASEPKPSQGLLSFEGVS